MNVISLTRLARWLLVAAGLLIVVSPRARADKATAPAASVEAPAANVSMPGETIFLRIELSPEGVQAVDGLGNVWYYHFTRGLFILDPLASGLSRGERNDREAETIEPVELRCTQLLEVPRPAVDQVFVGYDEYVEGDIRAYDRVTVKGWVKGDIIAFHDRVLVAASGRVDGTIKAPEIIVKRGGEVGGEQIITDATRIPVESLRESFSSAGIWVVFAFSLFFLLVAFVAVTLAPRQTENLAACIASYKAKTFLLGLLFVFLLPLLATLMAMTVVGAFFIPLLVLAYPAAMAIGMLTAGRLIGRTLLKSFFPGGGSLVFQGMSGVLSLMLLWTVVAVLLGASDSEAEGFGIFLLVVAILASTWPLLTGVGAAVLTRFGYRPYESYSETQPETKSQAPAPPPIPTVPPRSGPVSTSPPVPPRSRPGAHPIDPPLSSSEE